MQCSEETDYEGLHRHGRFKKIFQYDRHVLENLFYSRLDTCLQLGDYASTVVFFGKEGNTVYRVFEFLTSKPIILHTYSTRDTLVRTKYSKS